MQCPNCDSEERLLTVETFQTKESTYRTKKCPSCLWKFTTKEDVTDDSIPDRIRRAKKKGFMQHGQSE